MCVLPRPAGANRTELNVVAGRERIEYVGGPLDGTSGEVEGLPDELPLTGGRYVRSVRCAEDGAMRYVWLGYSRAEPGAARKGSVSAGGVGRSRAG
jgi:hypothetical protein